MSRLPIMSGLVIVFSIYTVGMSNTGAENFTLERNLGGITAFSADVAALQSNVYVVWSDNATGNGDIYFKKSNDNGTTFGSHENLSNGEKSSEPQIYVSENNVFVVWTEDNANVKRIYLKASMNSGEDFKPEKRISRSINLNSTSPQVSGLGDNVFVVWTEDNANVKRIYLKASMNSGEDFKPAKRIQKPFNLNFASPQVGASEDNVYVYWTAGEAQNSTIGNFDTLLRMSSNGGKTFEAAKNLSKLVGISASYPDILVSSGKVYATWSDRYPPRDTGSYDVFFQLISNGTISVPINVSNNMGNSTSSSIAVAGSNLYLVWIDDTNGKNQVGFRHIDLSKLALPAIL